MKHSEKTKRLLSKIRKEYFKDPKNRAAHSKRLTGIKRSAEARARISKSRTELYRSGKLKHPLQIYSFSKEEILSTLKQFNSQAAAAKALGVSQMTISRAKRKFNIDHDGKDLMKHGRGIGGYYQNVWMRSSWEISFAQLLTKFKINWKYEFKKFKLLDGRTLCPDFFLPDLNLWIEIKGHWYEPTKKKFKLFLDQFKEINIAVIQEQIWKAPPKDLKKYLLTKVVSSV